MLWKPPQLVIFYSKWLLPVISEPNDPLCVSLFFPPVLSLCSRLEQILLLCGVSESRTGETWPHSVQMLPRTTEILRPVLTHKPACTHQKRRTLTWKTFSSVMSQWNHSKLLGFLRFNFKTKTWYVCDHVELLNMSRATRVQQTANPKERQNIHCTKPSLTVWMPLWWMRGTSFETSETWPPSASRLFYLETIYKLGIPQGYWWHQIIHLPWLSEVPSRSEKQGNLCCTWTRLSNSGLGGHCVIHVPWWIVVAAAHRDRKMQWLIRCFAKQNPNVERRLVFVISHSRIMSSSLRSFWVNVCVTSVNFSSLSGCQTNFASFVNTAGVAISCNNFRNAPAWCARSYLLSQMELSHTRQRNIIFTECTTAARVCNSQLDLFNFTFLWGQDVSQMSRQVCLWSRSSEARKEREAFRVLGRLSWCS